MPEEKQEKKKLGIVKRILKWIGLGLLILLLIAGLIFQAPWKVIMLLLVILLACTILPRPYRKYFWLSVAAVVIALIIWVFLPEKTEGWRSYTFDEELAAIEAKRAIPDSENAATIYNQLLEDYNEATLEPNFLDPNLEGLTRKEPWSSQNYPKLAQWLKSQESTIAKLMEVSKIEKCRFPIAADSLSLSQTMERLSPMRRWAFLLIRAANNDIAEGRTNQALEKYITVMQTAKHQYQQPKMIDLLVGISLEALAIRQFNTFVVTGDATEAHLSVIEEALTDIKHDWSSDLPKILECEKLLFKNTLGMFYETNPKGQARLSRNPLKTVSAQYKELLPSRSYWFERLAKVAFIKFWFFMPSSPQKAGEIIDASYEKLCKMAEPDFDWQKGTEKPTKMFRLNYRYLVEYLAGILKPGYHRIHDLYLRLTSDQRASRIIIALRRYKNKTGQWPENLDTVKSFVPQEIFVDPHNGNSFVYKLTEEDFTLYSKGKNNIDEGGKYKRRYGETSEGDDWLIWPPKSRKTQEKNADAKQQ